ncbi:MAG: ribosome hibernation-promoting factor, HPF/YfiA family [Dongiales bacterium]|jgi:ribosomal subunit interface protein|nr:ribosome-associated translation inhibitor RaiA [Caulobacteraceae bacterium]
MRVQVSGRHVDVGEALRTRINDQLSESIGRYFERGGDAEVVVARDKYGFRVDCSVALASGQMLQSHGIGADAPAAFNQALEKIAVRIRRYKRRLKSHTPAANAKAAETAALYVLRAPGEDDELDGWSEGEAEAPPAGMIIAETETALRTMTVSMAVLELDLIETQTIVFRNAAHGGLSVVYRRSDGNIGWIDPVRTAQAGGRSRAGSRREAAG